MTLVVIVYLIYVCCACIFCSERVSKQSLVSDSQSWNSPKGVFWCTYYEFEFGKIFMLRTLIIWLNYLPLQTLIRWSGIIPDELANTMPDGSVAPFVTNDQQPCHWLYKVVKSLQSIREHILLFFVVIQNEILVMGSGHYFREADYEAQHGLRFCLIYKIHRISKDISHATCCYHI